MIEMSVYDDGGEANAANNNKYVAHSWLIEGDLPEGLTFDEETSCAYYANAVGTVCTVLSGFTVSAGFAVLSG